MFEWSQRTQSYEESFFFPQKWKLLWSFGVCGILLTKENCNDCKFVELVSSLISNFLHCKSSFYITCTSILHQCYREKSVAFYRTLNKKNCNDCKFVKLVSSLIWNFLYSKSSFYINCTSMLSWQKVHHKHVVDLVARRKWKWTVKLSSFLWLLQKNFLLFWDAASSKICVTA